MLSTIEDGVAELLANPLEQTVHRQLVDRLAEESPDPRRALLDLVIRHRDSDGPRLAFAQWCEANGEGKRAEFVRVQIELAKCPAEKTGGRRSGDLRWLIGEPWDALRRREWDLWTHGFAEAFGPPKSRRGSGVSPSSWKRGFFARWEGTAAAWLVHADAILSEHPVERVRLTTEPRIEEYAPTITGPLRLRGRDRWHDFDAISKYVYGNEGRAIGLIEAMLELEFPGIEFELPSMGVDPATGRDWTGYAAVSDSVDVQRQYWEMMARANPEPDPRLAEIDRLVAMLDGRLSHLLASGPPAINYPPPLTFDEQVRLTREQLAEYRRFRERAGRDPSVLQGVSDVRQGFAVWQRNQRRGARPSPRG